MKSPVDTDPTERGQVPAANDSPVPRTQGSAPAPSCDGPAGENGDQTGGERTSRIRSGSGLLVGLLLAVIILAFIGPFLPLEGARTVAPPYASAGGGLFLGSDGLGRDVFARLLHGGGGLILIALGATIAAVAVGLILGFIMSIRSLFARALQVVVDIVLVIPPILTMLVLIFGLGGGIATMFLITAAVTVPFVARYTRALIVPLLGADFVLAARLAGDGWIRVALRDIAPNLAGPLLADAGARFVGALYIVASAGFLGFNPLGGDGDWATMIQANLDGLGKNPWASLAPAFAVVLITVPANLLADRWTRRLSR
ncbi:ABC transporter permease subunit [Actinomycetaceae bacterium L2_0104]